MEPYQYSGANVTVFRIVDPSTEKMDAFLQFQEQIDLNIDDDDEDENDDERTGAEKGIEQTVCAVDSDGKIALLLSQSLTSQFSRNN